MSQPDSVSGTDQTYEPRRPLLYATGLLSIWVLFLSLPMWTGKFLAGRFSDQYDTGYAFRDWLASEWKRTGSIPLWNPELFGGMPFVGAMHGDIFYPTSWLRLILPTGLAMNLGFVIHYLVAGVLVYLLLRMLKASWSAAVVGGLAYQLSGVIGSYVQPGHDGKLFVTALLPLALIGLVMGMRDRRWEGYGVLALSVGLALLSPHAQMTYYMLIVAGIFALYLAFGEAADSRTLKSRFSALGFAFAAVVVGFGIGMIQILPFYHYIPFSPRAEGYYGFAGSTSYAIPWSHVPEFFFAGFTGSTPEGTYWATNPGKLHSEYLGLPVIALALAGAMGTRRRLVLWLSGIGALFLLIGLGAGTPFYRVWWEIMPFVKQTRAPGMALYAVALVLAILAAFGVERLERGEAKQWAVPWMVAGAVVTVLALAGGFGALATSIAQDIELSRGIAVTSAAQAGQDSIRWGAMGSGVALALVGLLCWGRAKERLPVVVLAIALPLVVGADLWRNARDFWTFTEAPASGLYAPDEVTEFLSTVPKPYRVLDFPRGLQPSLDVYPGSSLMAFSIPQLFGYHGNELHAFDELAGGKNRWANLLNPRFWDLLAIRFLVVPANISGLDSVPGFRPALSGVMTSTGQAATVLERVDPVPYAWLVPAGIKVDSAGPEDQPMQRMIAGIMNPANAFDPGRLVLFGPEAPVELPVLDTIPDPIDVRVVFDSWEPGKMELRLEPAAPRAGYLVISENYYPDWRAWVDDQPTEVLRGNVSLITVPVPAGAREIRLEFRSAEYRTGRAMTFLSLLAVGVVLLIPPMVRRRRG